MGNSDRVVALVGDIEAMLQPQLVRQVRVEKTVVGGPGVVISRPAGEVDRKPVGAGLAQAQFPFQQVGPVQGHADIGGVNRRVGGVAHDQFRAAYHQLEQSYPGGAQGDRYAQFPAQDAGKFRVQQPCCKAVTPVQQGRD